VSKNCIKQNKLVLGFSILQKSFLEASSFWLETALSKPGSKHGLRAAIRLIVSAADKLDEADLL